MTADQRAAYMREYIANVKKRTRANHTGKKTCCGQCFLKAHREYMAGARATERRLRAEQRARWRKMAGETRGQHESAEV